MNETHQAEVSTGIMTVAGSGRGLRGRRPGTGNGAVGAASAPGGPRGRASQATPSSGDFIPRSQGKPQEGLSRQSPDRKPKRRVPPRRQELPENLLGLGCRRRGPLGSEIWIPDKPSAWLLPSFRDRVSGASSSFLEPVLLGLVCFLGHCGSRGCAEPPPGIDVHPRLVSCWQGDCGHVASLRTSVSLSVQWG